MPEPLNLLIDRFDTPIGEMVIVADHDGNLRAVEWTDHEERLHRSLRLHYGRNGFKLEPVGRDVPVSLRPLPEAPVNLNFDP